MVVAVEVMGAVMAVMAAAAAVAVVPTDRAGHGPNTREVTRVRDGFRRGAVSRRSRDDRTRVTAVRWKDSRGTSPRADRNRAESAKSI